MFIENDVCTWCGKELNDYYLIGYNKDKDKLKFCNFVCAKHYNDIKEKIHVNMDKYAELYLSNKLDKQSAKIYQTVSKRGFEFMPTIYNTPYSEDMNERKRQSQDYINKIYECH